MFKPIQLVALQVEWIDMIRRKVLTTTVTKDYTMNTKGKPSQEKCSNPLVSIVVTYLPIT
jgi:hypothetical protein